MLILAPVLMVFPENGYDIIITIIAAILFVRGFERIIYYFTMARFMVGGRTVLYTGIVLLDFGVISASLTYVPHYYILLYLIGVYAFTGAVEVLRAFEARSFGGSWKLKIGHGLVNIALAALCVIFMKRMSIAVVVYSLGLIYSGVLRIITACRRSKLIFIQ